MSSLICDLNEEGDILTASLMGVTLSVSAAGLSDRIGCQLSHIVRTLIRGCGLFLSILSSVDCVGREKSEGNLKTAPPHVIDFRSE